MAFTPIAFNLAQGIPHGFVYNHEINSQISATEAFETGIDQRDGSKCIVCGWYVAQYGHIIPRGNTGVVRSTSIFTIGITTTILH